MVVKNEFRVSFMGAERKWIGNSFIDFYRYINSIGIVNPNGQGIDQNSTWFS
jgi:hypothetical protein